ncbi:MAG TPA: hypothetical protein ACFYD9_04370 [Candidatus Wunengus sp. YC64]|uniref:hypothetical protein n=1 Tax=Candidatus Wunengus sp. YC64 TaxID=3367700 RepID=UPI004025F2E1
MRNVFFSIAYSLLIVCWIFGACSRMAFAEITPTPTPTPVITPQAPTVRTGEATDFEAGPTATLNGTVNAHGLPTTAWFEYGTASSTYDCTTSTQTVSGSSDTTVSINTSELPIRTGSPYTFYYRIAAQNSAGTSYGDEKSFKPLMHGDCPGCFVTGYVTDVTTGKSIEKAIVSGENETVLTEADGSYVLKPKDYSLCWEVVYMLTAAADGYISQTKSTSRSETSCYETLNFELQPTTCEAETITVFPNKLRLKRGQSDEVFVTLEGDNCVPEGKTVSATIGKNGNSRISLSSTNEVTDESGQVKFTITAKDKIGKAKVTFKTDNLKKSIIVKVR